MIRKDIKAAIKDFEGMSKIVSARLETAIKKTVLDVQVDFVMASPVGKTGHFRSSWETETDIEGGTVAGVIFNPMIYAEPLEIGSKKGKRPWKSAGPRTVEESGRIWSSQAPGGIMSQIADDKYVNGLTENIENYITEGLK